MDPAGYDALGARQKTRTPSCQTTQHLGNKLGSGPECLHFVLSMSTVRLPVSNPRDESGVLNAVPSIRLKTPQ
jgi:hypothetical protein